MERHIQQHVVTINLDRLRERGHKMNSDNLIKVRYVPIVCAAISANKVNTQG